MKTSSLEILQSPEVIVLAAGHGDKDSGATFGQFKESEEAITIVDRVAALLKERDVNVAILPHELDLEDSIAWVNKRFKFGEAWVIEVHRDSADNLDPDDASRRCGIYTGTSSRSIEVGTFVRQSFLRHGAHSKSWNRLHTESPRGSLGWIRQTIPAAHLIELGFMEGRNDDEHLTFLARVAGAALYEAFTGHSFEDTVTRSRAVELVSRKTRSRGLSREVTTAAATPSSADLLKSLATAYRDIDLAAVFKKVKADVRPEDYSELKEATLAQWILESGWASSKLAREALNFGGLKFRKELKPYATEYQYTDWQGETTMYCKFDTLEAFITGYWAFIQRDVYRGWTEHTGSAADFIDYLLDCGYTNSDTYLNEVMSLVPKAAVLLG